MDICWYEYSFMQEIKVNKEDVAKSISEKTNKIMLRLHEEESKKIGIWVLKFFTYDFNRLKKEIMFQCFNVQVFYEKGLGFRTVELVQDPMEIEGRIVIILPRKAYRKSL